MAQLGFSRGQVGQTSPCCLPHPNGEEDKSLTSHKQDLLKAIDLWGEAEGHRMCRAVIENDHRWGGLNNTNLFFSYFWSLEVQNQGIGRNDFF
jgi:hypothetical protein